MSGSSRHSASSASAWSGDGVRSTHRPSTSSARPPHPPGSGARSAAHCRSRPSHSARESGTTSSGRVSSSSTSASTVSHVPHETSSGAVAGVVVRVVGFAQPDERDAVHPELLLRLARGAGVGVLADLEHPAGREVEQPGVDVLRRRAPVEVDAAEAVTDDDCRRTVAQVLGPHA